MSEQCGLKTVVIFLRDGLVTIYSDLETCRQGYDSGDLVCVSRSSKCKPESAIVLGEGGTTADAKEMARSYWKRLCKWHGNEEATELFGHPVDKVKAMSQVSIFTDSESEDECYTVGSCTDSQDIDNS